MKELLQKLTQTPGPSGYESAVRDVIRAEIKPYAKDIKVDALGNLIVKIGKKTERGLRIMVAAHMDEIGLMVSHVEKNGTMRFSNLGSVFPRYLPGSRVRFLNGVRGVIDSVKPEDLTKIQPLNQFFIDVGCSSDKNCPVKAGDVAVFDREFTDLGQRVTSKALDDRSSCALLVEAIKAIKDTPHELNLVFSVQEEVGSRGATTAAYGLEVDLGLALDVTPVGQLMGVKLQVELGKARRSKYGMWDTWLTAAWSTGWWTAQKRSSSPTRWKSSTSGQQTLVSCSFQKPACLPACCQFLADMFILPQK